MANRIKEFRTERGWSMEQLGVMIGTGRQQIDKLEKGRRRLDQDWLEKLARAFGVHPADIMVMNAQTNQAAADEVPQIARHRGTKDMVLSGKYGETIEQIRSSVNQALVPLHPEMLPIALAAAKQLVDVLERASATEDASRSDPSSKSTP